MIFNFLSTTSPHEILKEADQLVNYQDSDEVAERLIQAMGHLVRTLILYRFPEGVAGVKRVNKREELQKVREIIYPLTNPMIWIVPQK